MEFRVHTDLPANATLRLSTSSHVALLGSCFAEGVGERLSDALPEGHTLVNPFGVVYNPLSICRLLDLVAERLQQTSIALAIGGQETAAPTCAATISPYIFQGRDGLWHSWLHTTHFSATTREACLSKVTTSLVQAQCFLEQTDVLCLTWGTAYVFELLRGGGLQAADGASRGSAIVVSNCHKEPQSTFTHRRATIDEIATQTIATLRRLRQLRPTLQVLLTVSPYRYAKSGLHQSTLAKSTLHLAAERITDVLPFAHYFPAYEIVIDELRDYRFYAADMLHPSPVATDYVWERFRSWCFTPELEQFAAEKQKRLRAERHRPLLN